MLAEGSGPPVLLLHGSGPGTTAAAWAPLIAALAPYHRVIAPDLLGFGPGPRPAGSLRSAWTEQALELVDSLGISSFAVVGNSAGGAIALALARARAQRAVTRVVAVGSMGHPMALPAGLDELWGYTAPSLEAARSLLELINFDPRAATPDAVEARHRATLAQPWYPRAVPRAAPALGRRPVAHARGAGGHLRARPARARRAGPRRAAARRLPAAARAAARRSRARLRPLRPRRAARAHRRVQPTADHVPGGRHDDRLRRPTRAVAGAVRQPAWPPPPAASPPATAAACS